MGVGDSNTAHREMDLARAPPEPEERWLLPEERAALDAWVQAGFVDTFRHFRARGHYTWWRQWGESRENNVGWRIDYVFACPEAMPFVSRAFIWPEVRLSDRCPVGVRAQAPERWTERKAKNGRLRGVGRITELATNLPALTERPEG